MDAVARWKPRDRSDLFNEVGTARGMANAIVEKDFWVCWTLKRLFAGEISSGLVFKGGTSLSKSYGVIERFLEDIDLSFDRAALGYSGNKDPDLAGSPKQAERLIKRLVADVQAHVAGPFMAMLTEAIERELGPEKADWSVAVDPNDPQTINFRYPSSLTRRDYGDIAYVNPVAAGTRRTWGPVAGRVKDNSLLCRRRAPKNLRGARLRGRDLGGRAHLLGKGHDPSCRALSS